MVFVSLFPFELRLLRAVANPQHRRAADIARELGNRPNTLKMYLANICHKLGWHSAGLRELTLWVIGHREQLGIPIPTATEPIPALTSRNVAMLRALADPRYTGYEDIASALHVTHHAVKMHIHRLYSLLGWSHATQRELVLWAIAHREELGIELPPPDEVFPLVFPSSTRAT